MSYTDTTFRTYGKSKYEKTDKGWAKQVEEKQQAAQSSQKEYTDEELAGFARKASDASLKKAGAGANERMRIAAKKELLRRQSEGASEPEPSENPFDDGMKKGLFDEFPTRMFGETEYINKGQGWEILEKGRGAQIGEIRDWKGGKYQKTANGWVPYTQGQGGSGNKGEGGNLATMPYDPKDATKIQMEDDSFVMNSLKNILNNYYHYVSLHSSGDNSRKFSAKDVTNFRNSIKGLAEGEEGSNVKAGTEEAKNFLLSFYAEIKKVKSDDFEGAKKKLEELGPSVGRYHSLIKQKMAKSK